MANGGNPDMENRDISMLERRLAAIRERLEPLSVRATVLIERIVANAEDAEESPFGSNGEEPYEPHH